nr:MAG TPA: hypothetical protein [Caudoviricetes sp.]
MSFLSKVCPLVVQDWSLPRASPLIFDGLNSIPVKHLRSFPFQSSEAVHTCMLHTWRLSDSSTHPRNEAPEGREGSFLITFHDVAVAFNNPGDAAFNPADTMGVFRAFDKAGRYNLELATGNHVKDQTIQLIFNNHCNSTNTCICNGVTPPFRISEGVIVRRHEILCIGTPHSVPCLVDSFVATPAIDSGACLIPDIDRATQNIRSEFD